MPERLRLSDLTAVVPHERLVRVAADKALGSGFAKLDELDAAIRKTERDVANVCRLLDACNDRGFSDRHPDRLRARRLRRELIDALGNLQAERDAVASLLLQPTPVGEAIADAIARSVPDAPPAA